MANIQSVSPGSTLGTALQQLLMCDEIVPGAEPSYQICKTIYLYHPLGQKMTETPIRMAQSLPREISVPDGPEDDCVEAFEAEWRRMATDNIICNVGTQARVYGIASMAVVEEGVSPAAVFDMKKLADAELAFNVLDPLNTAGSLVLNQDPNAIDFQKHRDIAVNGIRYHRSRTVTLMNENPIYIAYTSSSFGFVGRSVYQRALFPLKSFVQTMIADDMVARKVGLIVAMLKMASSIVDRVMAFAAAFKRQLLKVGQTDNVISISIEEKIESLNLANLEGPLLAARKDILENIATAAPMPAKLLNNETFAEGFGEGTEDAKHVAEYLDGVRSWLMPLYEFMDGVVQRRAWNERFFAVMQKKFPEEYGKMDYEQAFYRWSNSFKAEWPSLLREPESELVRVDEVKFKTIVAAYQVLRPDMDPDNSATLTQWFADNLNFNKRLFPIPLNLDYEALAEYTPPEQKPLEEPAEGKPFADDGSGTVVSMMEGRMNRVEQFLQRNGRAISQIARSAGP